ncbi:MAG: universal stress protein [Gemmatimonadota bacterium]
MTAGIREILVPLDGSGPAEWAVPTAAAIARQSGARIHLMLVHASLARAFPDVTAAGFLDRWEDEQRERETEYVQRIARRLRAVGLDALPETVVGDPASRIVERGARSDLVVVTSHGWAGPDRAWLGSVADAVVHHVRKPVLVLRPDSEDPPDDPGMHHPGFRRDLVATDGGDAARAAEAFGADVARLFHATLMLFRAVRVPAGPSSPYIPHAAVLDREATAEWEEEARQYLEARAKELTGPDIHVQVDTTYHTARAILDAAIGTGADLVAVGTHREGRLARAVLGSVADKVVRGAAVPVVVAHADRS